MASVWQELAALEPGQSPKLVKAMRLRKTLDKQRELACIHLNPHCHSFRSICLLSLDRHQKGY
jgi:hypothetical protein